MNEKLILKENVIEKEDHSYFYVNDRRFNSIPLYKKIELIKYVEEHINEKIDRGMYCSIFEIIKGFGITVDCYDIRRFSNSEWDPITNKVSMCYVIDYESILISKKKE